MRQWHGRSVLNVRPMGDTGSFYIDYAGGGTGILGPSAYQDFINQQKQIMQQATEEQAMQAIKAQQIPQKVSEPQIQEVKEDPIKHMGGGNPQSEPPLEDWEKELRDNYYRDQRFRAYSDAISELNNQWPEENPYKGKMSDADYDEASFNALRQLQKNYPDYLKNGPNDNIYVEGYYIPEEKEVPEGLPTELPQKKGY